MITNSDVHVFEQIVEVNLDNGVEYSNRSFVWIKVIIWMCYKRSLV